MAGKLQLSFALKALLLTLALLAVSSASVKRENDSLPGNPNYPMTLKFLGTANGKSFFTDFERFDMTWSAAGAFCEESRLSLASIETRPQADLLSRVIPELGYVGSWYWTSGKESRRGSMFTWNGTEKQVNSDLASSWKMYGEEHWCVAFYTRGVNDSQLQAYPCNERHLRPLCQT